MWPRSHSAATQRNGVSASASAADRRAVSHDTAHATAPVQKPQ